MRKTLRGEAVHWPDWQQPQQARFLNCVIEQGVVGLLYDAVRVGRCTGAPVETVRCLAAETHRTAALNMTMVESALRAIGALEAVEVRCAALKGLAMLADGYENAGLRPMTDIDILVAPSEMDKAAHALFALGYDMEPSDTPAVAHHWTFARRDQAVAVDVIELHRQLFVEAPFDLGVDSSDLLARRRLVNWRADGPVHASQPSPVRMPVLSLADSLLHAAGHLVIQHAGGERLIWLADVDRLVRRGGVADGFWTEVAQRSRVAGLHDALEQALNAAEAWFGTDLPETLGSEPVMSPVSRRARGAPNGDREETVPQVRRAGLQRAGRPPGARAWSDIVASTSWRRRITLARAHVLPAPGDMRTWYGVAHSWQLPWYYMRRWLRGARDVVVDRSAPPAPVRTPDQWFVQD